MLDNWCDASKLEKETYCDRYTDCSQCPYFDREDMPLGGDIIEEKMREKATL